MFLELLKSGLPGVRIGNSVPWSSLTTIGVGGGCPCTLHPADEDELSACITFCREHGVPTAFLGGGSNLIGTDMELETVFIVLDAPKFSAFEISGRVVRAGAGAALHRLAAAAAEAGLGGLSCLSGIPGTLGGALTMNSGAGGHAVGELVRSVSGIGPDGRKFVRTRDELRWEYRRGALPGDCAIVEAELELAPSDVEKEKAALAAEAARRAGMKSGRSAGCVFRNAGGCPAGKLVELAGCRGRSVGGCRVSDIHANYIVNTGGGTAADFDELAAAVRSAVWEKLGVRLEYEVRFAATSDRMTADGNLPEVRAAILCGGDSSEREVSLRSGAAVAAAAAGAGFNVRCEDIRECALPEWLDDSYVIFPVLHGGFGENGGIQKLMEERKLAFVGSGSASCALVMDKIASKKAARKAGIPTADWWELPAGELPERAPDYLEFPLVAKIPDQGSTVGIELVKSAEEFPAAMRRLSKFKSPVLLEKFIDGIEITVPVICGKAFPVIEIRPPEGFYDYDAKYVYAHGHTEYLCPPEKVLPEEQALAGEYAVRFAEVCGCRDMVRVDFIVDSSGVPVLLEGNSIPGFTATSLVPKSALAAGWEFELLVGRLLQTARLRKEPA